MTPKPSIQKLYEYIKARGKMASFEIFDYGTVNKYTSAPRHARDLAGKLSTMKKYPGIIRREPYLHERNGHKKDFIMFEYGMKDENGQGKLL